MDRGESIMQDHPIIRFLRENKKVPTVINIGLHAVSINILYSFLLMCLSVFILQPHWDSRIIKEVIPIIGFFAPYSFYTIPINVSYLWGILASAWLWGTWLFGTRVKVTNKTFRRRLFSFSIAWLSFCFIIIFYSLRLIRVIGYEKVVSYHYTIDVQYQEMMHIGSLQIIGYLLMILPIGVMVSFTTWLIGQYKRDERIQEWFRTFKYENGWLGRFGEQEVNLLPDIQLARNAETNAPVVLQGESRQLGTLLIGPPGSGKTSIKIKTAFRTDLGHLQKMINSFPKYSRRFGYGTEGFIKRLSNHLIGSIIIEPAKDLCDDAYELAVEHNIPKEFIVYLDPSNPDTPGFNMMVGPTAEVVETITSVLESVAETKDEFFKQAARSVLKHYVYLLKFSKNDNCTILDLDDLYQDPRKAMDLLEELEKTIPSQEVIETMDQDGRIHWIIVQKIVRWFRNEGLAVQTSREGMVEKYPAGHEHAGKAKVMDLQFEFTRQTRNLLSDITKNPYLARILYADNAVDLSRLFTKGGILLVNTDLGNLKALSAIFGKIVLLCVQNAVFRRKGTEKTRPMVSFYADEFYDYMNESFLQLTSQGRKYKFAPLVACQSLTQFGVKFGKDFTESMLGTIRNTIVYGGTSLYDTEMLSKYLGKEIVEDLEMRESYSPTYMDNPSFSISESTRLIEKEIATSDDIMFQEFRYSYIRLVDEKSSKKAIKAVGDFVDTSEAEKWKKALNPKALEEFMEYWHSDDNQNIVALSEQEEDLDTLKSLKKELDSIDMAQEEIRKENVERGQQEENHTGINSRLKPFTEEQLSKTVNSDTDTAISTNAKTIDIKPEVVELEMIVGTHESSIELEQMVKVKDRKIPEPAVPSPFEELHESPKLVQTTISFTDAFGSKDKEKLEMLGPKKKDNSVAAPSFSNTFNQPQSLREVKHEAKPSEQSLKEVTLDNNAERFLEELKKNR